MSRSGGARVAIAACALLAAAPAPGRTAAAFAVPAWLRLREGTFARVAQAPWPAAGSEAALTGSEDSAKTDPDDYLERPADAVHEPAGIRVLIEDVYDDRTVLVRPQGVVWDAYTRIDLLQPEVPAGTHLVIAGGFGRYAYFYPQLATPTAHASELPDGTPLVALAESIAPAGLGSDDLVRLEVRVLGGAARGRVGWVPVNYTGLPLGAAAPQTNAERDCRCRVLEFR